jgi:filamentous hemagglutinin
LTGRQFTPKQLELLKADLRENNYSRLSREEVKLNRAEFNDKLPSLRAEWEKNTGEIWPKEKFTDKNGNMKTRNYDAHHVIENKFGGKAEWWNITPAMRGGEHQGGIHRAQGPAEKIFGK